MQFKMIVAIDEKNGIGKKGTIPWYIPEDLKYFSRLTKGNGNNAVIMGRKTYESIGKALPKRKNLVLTRDTSFNKDKNDIYCFSSIESIEENLKTEKYNEVWVIGGASLYNSFITKVNELYVTEIDGDFDCDTFFVDDYEKLFDKIEVIGKNQGKYSFIYKKYFS